MELYKELLAHALMFGQLNIVFPGKEADLLKITENVCYQTLLKIKRIIEDDSLDDIECFYKIDEIVRTFEELGCSDMGRHDFG